MRRPYRVQVRVDSDHPECCECWNNQALGSTGRWNTALESSVGWQPIEDVLQALQIALQTCLHDVQTQVLGIDHSAVMVRQATSRNREAVGAGRVELRLGTLEDLRPEDGSFQKILSVNCAQFWDDRERTLRTLFEALVSDGTLAITYQPRHPGATEGDAFAFAEQATEIAKTIGFTETRTEKLDLQPVCAVCLLLTK